MCVCVCVCHKIKQEREFLIWTSALCTRVNGNPAPIIRFMQFHYCTVSNPGTGADDAFVLKLHMALTQPTSDSHWCAPVSNLFSPLVFWLLVYLLLFMHQAMCNIIWHLRMCTDLFRSYFDAGLSLISNQCLSRSILFIAVVSMAHSV